MVFDTFRIGNQEFKIDPETNFWGVGDTGKLEKLYRKVSDEILVEMNQFRFRVDVMLLYLNPTDTCNAQCPYCYLPQKVKARSRNMSDPELDSLARKALQYFNSKGIKGSIVFHGTEPLVIKESLFKLIENYGKDLFFGIQTNGILLSQEDADFIRRNHVNIGLSLDSPSENTNDSLRGRGQYRKIMQALGWFKGYRGLNVVVTISNRNVHQLSDMIRFLHEKEIGLCLMNPVRGTQKEAMAYRPDPSTLTEEFIKAVEESIRLTKTGRRIVIGDFANVLLAIIAPSARVMMCDISPCGGGRRFFSVTANGDSYPCGEFIGMEEFRGGNILTQSIENIVESGNFLKVRERIVENIEECKSCSFRNICGASCPAEIYSIRKTMFSKSDYCEFYKRVAEHAFRIIARNDVEHVIKKSALREMYNLDTAAL